MGSRPHDHEIPAVRFDARVHAAGGRRDARGGCRRTRSFSYRGVPRPDAEEPAGRARRHDRASRGTLERRGGGFCRCHATCAASRQSARGDDLAGNAAVEHSRQHLAARHRIRRAGLGYRTAGCPGMRPSGLLRWATRMSRGIPTAPTDGRIPSFRSTKPSPPLRAANRPGSFPTTDRAFRDSASGLTRPPAQSRGPA